MKVGDLIKKAHLYGEQKIKINDHSTDHYDERPVLLRAGFR